MGDMGELYNALRAQNQEQRAARAAQAPAMIADLTARGHTVKTLSANGPHLRVDGKFDFWPSTGRWIVTGGRRGGKGLKSLQEALAGSQTHSTVRAETKHRGRRVERH